MTSAPFPHLLSDTRAFDVAQAMLEGFDRHYRLFRETSAAAKERFERADWHGQQRAQAQRIEFYDLRVAEAAERLQREFDVATLSMDSWQQAKLHYVGLLIDHHQPELAETFFNSVTVKLLHRSYFRNDFIFVRPAVSTEYIENDEPTVAPTYRAYYPTRDSMHETMRRVVDHFQLQRAFEDLDRDIEHVLQALQEHIGLSLQEWTLRPNFQIQVLSSLFYRNKGAYLVGRIVNGFTEVPFALAILHTPSGRLAIDTAMFREDELLILFSFARAYFMVDMEIPSAYVQFLRSLMPRKARSELYSALGLQKQGKNMFYRDFLHHLRHSQRRVPHRAGHQGHGHAGLRPAQLPVRVQGDQGLLPGAEGHHARADPGQVPARQAARPRRPHGRHARVQRRGVPARALRARADRRTAAPLPEHGRITTATRSSSATSTSSGA